MNYEYEFENEFNTDEEVEEYLDSIVNYIKEQTEITEQKPAVINAEKLKQIAYTYKILKYVTKGSKAKVTYKLHQPFRSMGSVSVTGKNIIFKNPKWFSAAAKLASNFNSYTKTDGTVKMDFTFHGLTTTLE